MKAKHWLSFFVLYLFCDFICLILIFDETFMHLAEALFFQNNLKPLNLNKSPITSVAEPYINDVPVINHELVYPLEMNEQLH